MKMTIDNMLYYVSLGKITFQVPQYSISINERHIETKKNEFDNELPDEWFIELKGGSNVPVIGKQQGYLFISKIGYEQNKEEILRRFVAAGGSVEELETEANKFYNKLEKSIHKKISQLQKDLNKLNSLLPKTED